MSSEESFLCPGSPHPFVTRVYFAPTVTCNRLHGNCIWKQFEFPKTKAKTRKCRDFCKKIIATLKISFSPDKSNLFQFPSKLGRLPKIKITIIPWSGNRSPASCMISGHAQMIAS